MQSYVWTRYLKGVVVLALPSCHGGAVGEDRLGSRHGAAHKAGARQLRFCWCGGWVGLYQGYRRRPCCAGPASTQGRGARPASATRRVHIRVRAWACTTLWMLAGNGPSVIQNEGTIMPHASCLMPHASCSYLMLAFCNRYTLPRLGLDCATPDGAARGGSWMTKTQPSSLTVRNLERRKGEIRPATTRYGRCT